MGRETVFPKNIRQIGEIQGKEKICIEDYVMTCIRKKEQQEENGYLGIFLGEKKETEDFTYVFIRGILEVPAEKPEEKRNAQEPSTEEERREETEKKDAKEMKEGTGKKTEDNAGQKRTEESLGDILEKGCQTYFPGWEIQGCCVIGVYPTKRMEALCSAFPDAGKIIYHLQEQEESLYLTEENQYRKLGGYFVFYEQNRKMQEYLAEIFKDDSVEKESLPDKAIKSFREKVKEKTAKKNSSLLKLAGSFFVITVLVIGVIVVNRIEDIRTVRTDMENGEYAAEISGSAETKTAGQILVRNGTDSGEGQTEGDIWEENSILSGSDSFWNHTPEDKEISSNTVSVDPAASEETINDEANSVITETADSGKTTGGAEEAMVETSNSEETTGGAAEAMAETAGSGDAMADTAGTMAETTGSEKATGAEEGAMAEAADPEAADDDGIQAASQRQIRASYVIRSGDTLADICSRYYGNLDKLQELCEENHITDADMILPGQRIVLP